jgi:general stress protein YciG
MAKRGPVPGSDGAKRIGDFHRGHHDHDTHGGFAANPQLASEAGKRGGETVKSRYGPGFYERIGRLGGAKVMAERGREYYATIGRAGGAAKGRAHEARAAATD